jgi:hypothetical protein
MENHSYQELTSRARMVKTACLRFTTGAVLTGAVIGLPDTSQAGSKLQFFIGDDDNAGNWSGTMSPFDNRDAAELAATNGAQLTDRSLPLTGGIPITFQFNGLPDLGPLAKAALGINYAGLDATNTYDVGLTTNLGNAILGTLPAAGLKIVRASMPVPIALLTNVSSAEITITSASNDNFTVFDFMDLNLYTVPEPGSLTLCLIGLTTAAAWLGWRQRQIGSPARGTTRDGRPVAAAGLSLGEVPCG